MPAPPLGNVQLPASHCVRSIGSSGPLVSSAGWRGDGGGGLSRHQAPACAWCTRCIGSSGRILPSAGKDDRCDGGRQRARCTQHLCSASLCVCLHHRLVTCSFQPATACDRSGARGTAARSVSRGASQGRRGPTTCCGSCAVSGELRAAEQTDPDDRDDGIERAAGGRRERGPPCRGPITEAAGSRSPACLSAARHCPGWSRPPCCSSVGNQHGHRRASQPAP